MHCEVGAQRMHKYFAPWFLIKQTNHFDIIFCHYILLVPCHHLIVVVATPAQSINHACIQLQEDEPSACGTGPY
jgi:hypothetical protein